MTTPDPAPMSDYTAPMTDAELRSLADAFSTGGRKMANGAVVRHLLATIAARDAKLANFEGSAQGCVSLALEAEEERRRLAEEVERLRPGHEMAIEFPDQVTRALLAKNAAEARVRMLEEALRSVVAVENEPIGFAIAAMKMINIAKAALAASKGTP